MEYYLLLPKKMHATTQQVLSLKIVTLNIFNFLGIYSSVLALVNDE